LPGFFASFAPFAADFFLRGFFGATNMLPRHLGAPQRQAKISSTLGGSSGSRSI
jgi:hypothetical protein